MCDSRHLRPIGSLLCLALLLACAGAAPPPPAVGPAEIAAAEQSGTLEALYDEIGAKLAAATDEAEAAQLRAAQAEVGERLATNAADEIRRNVSEAPLALGEYVPQNVLEAEEAKVEPLKAWSPAVHDALADELSSKMRATRSAIAEREALLASAAEDNIAGRLQILEELSALTGAGSAAANEYAGQRRQLVAELNAEVNAAIEQEQYEEAQRMLEIVQEVDPTNATTVEKIATVNTRVFEKDFYQALEQNDPDKAYAMLTDISNDESFELIRANLETSKDAMADYYVSLGAAATKKGDIPEAWRRFGEARNIRELLGEESPGPPKEEKAFFALLDEQYSAAMKRDEVGLAWGYLKVMSAMQSDTPALRRKLRETREQVLQRAIKRLSVSPFEDADDSSAEFGDAVANGVVQHLFETIPNDVRMIEREQLSDIMREKTIGGQDSAATGLAAADYLVQGTILEAKVDSTEKVGKKTMRVVTEQVEQKNPAHNAWVNLSSKERKNTPEPPRTIMVPRKEDVTTEVTVHRKVGIFSVSFRIIDAKTAKVIFADSVRKKVQHEDTSSEGVELGEFKMEFKMASLPSDLEILASLADETSSEIGSELVSVLADPEQTYAENARRFEREANYRQAAQQYAFAIVLSEQKDLDVEELTRELRVAAIATTRK